MNLTQAIKKIPLATKCVRAIRAARYRSKSPEAFRRYLATPGVKALNVGASGFPHPGWLNTDVEIYKGVYHLDASQLLPFLDASFDYVFSEHVIEHLGYPAAQQWLRECRRILKPGGTIRIATPDLAKLASLYQGQLDETQKNFITRLLSLWHPNYDGDGRAFVLNATFYNHGHRFLFDEATLKANLQKAGFQEIIRHSPGHSEQSFLKGLECRTRLPIADLNEFETMVLEAT